MDDDDYMTREERDKARRRGCFVAFGYFAIIIAGVFFWYAGTR